MKDCKINFNNNDYLANLQLRRLLQSDISIVQKLCQDWFPIDYPMTWYQDITSNPKFHALAAVLNNKLVGLLVAEIKSQLDCNLEDRNLLSRRFDKSTKVVYILVLGVVSEYRRKGIATYLLESLINFLTLESSNKNCKAIYLHTLTTNRTAINFYEKKSFIRHLYLPLYYYIDYEERDGFSYVFYINGGYPPIFKNFLLIDNLAPLINFVIDKINVRGIMYSLKKFVQRTIISLSLAVRSVSNANPTSDQETQLLFC